MNVIYVVGGALMYKVVGFVSKISMFCNRKTTQNIVFMAPSIKLGYLRQIFYHYKDGTRY